MATTVTIFPIANTGASARTSASVAYSGTASALFRVKSNTWSTDSPAINVSFAVQQSFDGGATWQDVASTVWNPGSFGKGGALPAIQITVGDVAGARDLRAVLSADTTLKVGISATLF